MLGMATGTIPSSLTLLLDKFYTLFLLKALARRNNQPLPLQTQDLLATLREERDEQYCGLIV